MNRQSFDLDKPNARKQFQDLLNCLLDYNADPDNDEFNDIHIRQEESFIDIEWDRVPYSGEYGGRWHFVESDEVVMKEVRFPDSHYEYLFPDEIDETLKEWHKKHPEWVKTSYGTWTNTEENRIFVIENTLDSWEEKKVSDSDSTFMRETFVMRKEDSLLTILMTVHPDVLKRTDYIVIGEDLLVRAMIDKNLFVSKDFSTDNKLLSKIGVYDLNFTSQNAWQDTPEQVCTRLHVYYDNKVKGHILFLTDSHYLIYRLDIEEEGE